MMIQNGDTVSADRRLPKLRAAVIGIVLSVRRFWRVQKAYRHPRIFNFTGRQNNSRCGQSRAVSESRIAEAEMALKLQWCPKNFLNVLIGDSRLLGAVLLLFSFLIQAVPVEAVRPEKLIRIFPEREGDTTHFVVENLQAADVTVTLEMKLSNLATTVPLPHTQSYKALERVKVLSLSPKDPDHGWSWEYTYYATYGSVNATHDDAFVYALPYPQGRTFRVSQGFNGDYSHFGPNQFALDWKMPIGTPVHAARGGIVVAIKDDSDRGGSDSKYDGDANFIMIRHSDHTFGHYVHLAKRGSKVRVGQRVETGDLIGLSGNTGHTTGPHLHFAVFKAKDGKERQTLPIRFETSRSMAVSLEQGKSYTAAQRGRAAKNNPTAASLAVVQPNRE